MTKAQRKAAEEAPASIDEIKQAIAGLTTGELLRLRKFAFARHRTLGLRGAGRNPEDLLSDALIALLERRRKWIKSRCDLVKFLIEAIRSLSSHIRSGKATDAFDDLTPLVAKEEDDPDPIDQLLHSTASSPEDELVARELDQHIRAKFAKDQEALTVYQGFCERMTPAEIRDCGFTVQQFDTAAKRLRRGVTKITEGGRP